MPAVPLAGVEFMIVDYEQRRRGVIMVDGRKLFEPLGPDEPQVENIARSIFSPERWWMFIHTTAGDVVILETYSPVPEDPLKGRPVIYLDQMHWRTLADIKRGRPEDVRRTGELGPAADLLLRADDGQVILPMSGGTLSETTTLYQANRYHAGIAIAQLASGWQMHSSIRVREDEIYQALAKQFGIQVEPMERVVTLKPRAVFSDGTGPSNTSLDYFIKCISWSATMVHMLIDPESVGKNAEKAEQWVAAQQTNTDILQADTIHSAQEKRKLAYGLVWHDLRAHVARGAENLRIGQESISRVDFDRLRRDCPSVRIYAHWMMLRLTNKSGWKLNDLNDMTYLSCAAAYADYVVTEKQAANLLTQTQNALGLRRSVFPTIEACMAAFEQEHGPYAPSDA